MKKLQVIKVDNDTVQKADLQTGCNNISRIVGRGHNYKQIIKHALSINVSPEGEMTITPYQVSPCYVKPHGTLNWQLVGLGTSVPIKPGDICSLLQDKCWLKIIDSDIMEDIDNNLKRKMEEDTKADMLIKKARSASNVHILMPNNDNLRRVVSKDDINSNTALGIYFEDNTSEHNMAKGDNSSETENLLSVACEEHSNGNSDVEQSEQLLSKEQIDIPSNTAVNEDAKSEGTSNATDVGETDKNRNHLSSRQQKQPNPNPPGNAQGHRRDKCAYGNTCYRRNDYHKSKFSHPGDSDYDTADNRPECSYGVRCYRKNVDHRAKYKHTSLRELRRKQIGRRKGTSNTTLDDYESSTEESIDESDYEPTEHSETSDDDVDDNDVNDEDDEEFHDD